MINLSTAIEKANTTQELNEIFSKKVNIQIGWIKDIVTVEGYEGALTTDKIAGKIMSLKIDDEAEETEDSKKLAASLAEKVFTPLTKLVESPENRWWMPYNTLSLARIGWTPPQDPRFGPSIALKHAMALGNLDRSYRVAW